MSSAPDLTFESLNPGSICIELHLQPNKGRETLNHWCLPKKPGQLAGWQNEKHTLLVHQQQVAAAQQQAGTMSSGTANWCFFLKVFPPLSALHSHARRQGHNFSSKMKDLMLTDLWGVFFYCYRQYLDLFLPAAGFPCQSLWNTSFNSDSLLDSLLPRHPVCCAGDILLLRATKSPAGLHSCPEGGWHSEVPPQDYFLVQVPL